MLEETRDEGDRNAKKQKEEQMDDLKKRKLEDAANDDVSSKEELRFLLDPLAKPQLVELLARLYISNPAIHLLFFSHLYPFIQMPARFYFLGFIGVPSYLLFCLVQDGKRSVK